MQSLAAILLARERDDSPRRLLEAALFGKPSPMPRMALAHLSRDASPTNSPYGEADSLGNPWDLVLAVEGALLLTPGAARRYGGTGGGALVAPFTVYPTAAGYGSAVSGETGRAELWLPLWSRWASRSEISNLARESRAQVGHGSSRRQARTGLDFARAAGELGVTRGIDAFERYAILERAGQSSLAVPAGRVSVSEQPHAAAMRSIDGWLGHALRFAKTDNCPSSIRTAARRLEQDCFQLASRGTPSDACAALEAIGAMEHALARSRSAIDAGIRPLHRASAADWIKAADDGTAEFAVAAALASLHDRRPGSPALRDYLHGTREEGTQTPKDKPRRGRPIFDAGRRHAVSGNNVARLLAAIHARRHLDATHRKVGTDRDVQVVEGDHSHDGRQHSAKGDLGFDDGTWCDMRTARQFAAGRLDDERILRLLWGLALLDHDVYVRTSTSQARDRATPAPIFDVLAIAWMQDALLRLRMAGLAPILTKTDLLTGAADASRLGSRLGAALLIRLRPTDLECAAQKLTISEQPDITNDQRETT